MTDGPAAAGVGQGEGTDLDEDSSLSASDDHREADSHRPQGERPDDGDLRRAERSMTYTFQIREVERWLEFNEFEGQVHGALDGVEVVCYLQVASVEQWDAYRPGVTMEVEAWVERRNSGVEIMLPKVLPKLEQVGDGVTYDIVGPLVTQHGEELQVDSVLPLRVDLYWAKRYGEPPPLRIGDVVRVRGALMIEPVGLDE